MHAHTKYKHKARYGTIKLRNTTDMQNENTDYTSYEMMYSFISKQRRYITYFTVTNKIYLYRLTTALLLD